MSYTPMSLGHLVMRVRDIDRSVDFYTRVMGLTIMEKTASGTVFMSANTEKSHELAIRAIGMDAGGPDHSIVGAGPHGVADGDVRRPAGVVRPNPGRTMSASCGWETMGSRWASTCWTRMTTRSKSTTKCPKTSGNATRRRACSATSTRASSRNGSRWPAINLRRPGK